MKKHLTKGEQTRERLLLAAQKVLAEFGEHKTTFQKIAQASGVSQALVVHYFKNRENIFIQVIRHILDDARVETELTLSKTSSAKAALDAYLDISLQIIRKKPDAARIFLLFYYKSAYDPAIAAYNDQIKFGATTRIENILKRGMDAGEFRQHEPKLLSKIIHTNLNGLLLTLISEPKQSFPDSKLMTTLKYFCHSTLLAEKKH